MAVKYKNKVKEYREKTGLTQSNMAEMLNITSDYFSMIERGARNPSFKLSKEIADILNTTIDALFFAQ